MRTGIVWLGVAIALALGACQRDAAPQATPAEAPSIEQDLAGLGREIDDLTLTTDDGARVRWGELNGKPRAVFFGFTHCPMICPVTIYELTRAMTEIGAPRDSMGMDFISVDPERDTPARLHEYLQSFDGQTRGLFAEGETLTRLTGAFEVVSRRQPLEAGGYTIDHTATVFLLDSSGRVVDVLAYGSPPDVIATRLRALLQLPPPPAGAAAPAPPG